ncbi:MULTISPECIES: hypothetical protein [Cryobacterium]|uniref:DNA-binding protein n=1 Tax=Cryobacterium breve TaxID=1259258 RepID=A0ABY2J757_9MICO|nr:MULTISPECIES: hypothetical protein [Cryobacterium]TFC95714.1 hypothetical protein E3T20_04915 [Cryobacterium sp. TmT3-12]TFD00153.1 hypothetical protein E3O65_03210 [Cryobacterium breve]
MGYFLAPATSAALSRLAAVDGSPGSAPLDRIQAIRSLLLELDADPATLVGVRDALRVGQSWDEISDAAELKPAAAKWRWSGTDAEIASRQAAGRKRAARPSAVPTDLPGLSVSEAAAKLGVTAQAIYLQLSRGKVSGRTIELPDGRSYKRVFLDGDPDARLDRVEPAADNIPTQPSTSSPDAH